MTRANLHADLRLYEYYEPTPTLERDAMSPMIDTTEFESPEFLRSHIQSILAFYDPIVGTLGDGLRGCFLDNGDSFSPNSRQLVATARYVSNYANAYRLYGDPKHKDWAQTGLDDLNEQHRQSTGHYCWLIENKKIQDNRALAYGHAFVLLASAQAALAGLLSAKETLRNVFQFMEQHFWEEDKGAYADERDSTLATLSPYRGQNANMHMCEALLAAWQATQDITYLDRAERLATKFAFDLADQTNGRIWEHYDEHWNVDMTYNIDQPNDRYKPWGFQPGHQMEWSKLLLVLDAERPNEKWRHKAQALYHEAMESGWDPIHGGLFYGVAPDGSICADKKYFWVQAESYAAAYRLYDITQDRIYLDDYKRIWAWSWTHMIDHEYGAWFQVRNRDGSPISNRKSPLGKTDYHTLSACWDVLSVMRASTSPNAQGQS